MNKPNIGDLCGVCDHPFGRHYQTYGGSELGCCFHYNDQRDGEYNCACKGYAVVYKYQEVKTS